MTLYVVKYSNNENMIVNKNYNKILLLKDFNLIISLIIKNELIFNEAKEDVIIEKFPLNLKKLELIRIPNLLKNIKIPNYIENLKVQLSFKDIEKGNFILDKIMPKINYNLKVLDLSNNRLLIKSGISKIKNINKLPQTLEILNLNNNRINTEGLESLIYILPNNIKELYLEKNSINFTTGICNKFPDSIKILDLNTNNITFIEKLLESLSNNIEILNLNNNDLKGFKNKENSHLYKFPNKLKELNLECNYYLDSYITNKFPETLKKLNISNSDININLSKFPNNIEILNISNIDNYKIIKNNILPKNLQRLDISNTYIIELPNILPKNLKYINCKNTNIIRKPILDNVEIDYNFDEINVTFVCEDCNNEIIMLDCRYREGLSGINYCEKCFNKNKIDKINLNKIVTIYNNNWYCNVCEYSFCNNDIRKHIHYEDYDICMKCFKKKSGKYNSEEYVDTLSYYFKDFEQFKKTIDLQKKICNNNLIKTIDSFRNEISVINLNIIKYICKKENINIILKEHEIKFILDKKIVYLVNWIIDSKNYINKFKIIESLSNNYYHLFKYIKNNKIDLIDELDYKIYKNLIENVFINGINYDSFNYLINLKKIKNINYDINDLIEKYINLYNDNTSNEKVQLLDNMFYKIKWYINSNIDSVILNNKFLIKCCEMNNLELIEILLNNIKIIDEDTLYNCFIQGCHNNNINLVKIIYERDKNIINRINTFQLLVLCIEDTLYELFKYLYEILNKCDMNQNNYYIFKEICKYYDNYNIENETFIDWYYNLNLINITDLSYNNEEFTYLSCINNNTVMFQWLMEKKPDINISIDNDKIFMECCQEELWNICDLFIILRPEYFKVDYLNGEVNYSINRVLTLINNKIKNISIEICNICMDNDSDCLTKCNHQFCKNCLDIWYKKNNKCPYCRDYLENTVYKL